ncbi:MAG TPA: YicC/YloC family endoribonuclease [Membranihabitans sp.]|nr:YicC/YloC family endoribonuclease [Membranihabitans sp.]
MYSMTGFGYASRTYDPYKINVEVKSLNSKFSDIRIKAPAELSMLEMDIRQITLEKLLRGKVEIQLTMEGQNLDSNISEIDERVFANYYYQIHRLADELNFEPKNILASIIQLPGVVKLMEFKVDQQMESTILEAVEEALDALMQHRKTEGHALAQALIDSIREIIYRQEKIAGAEKERMVIVKERLQQALEQHIPPEKMDNGRFEQELIYYLDKMDIHEEMVRLKQHCEYFLSELQNCDIIKGKKLSFITQEMGREINTLGSKANHAEIQRWVVEMKNELDKIKEQLANVL